MPAPIVPNYKPTVYAKAPAAAVPLQPAIIATVANFIPGAINTVSAQPGFVARAVVMPPGTIPNVDPGLFVVVAYVTATMSPAQLLIPNVTGIVVVDLPNGMLPPVGADQTQTIYQLISAAILSQLSPPPPSGTGNDVPPHS
jgi:hypothetical protein